MTPSCTRRDLLFAIGGAALALPAGFGATMSQSHSTHRPADPGLDAIAERIRKTPRSRIFELAGELVAGGATHEDLLGAVFLAGIHEVQPRPVGFRLHCVLMVESAWQLADASPPEERLLPALFNLDDFKVSQAGDEARGDWVLAARPDVAPHEAGVARKEFVAAMEAWDHERADRALVALLPHVDQDAFFDILWPFGLRCFRAVGHKIIFAAHVDRVLRRIGWRYAEPALRSLIFGLLDKGRDQDTASWVRGGVKAATLPTGWQGGQADPDASVALMAKLRVSDPSGAQDLVAGALGTGIAASSVWDAVRLAASDLFQRRPALLPVHAVTVTNALGYVARRTQDDGLRRRILLQAAAWIPVIRDAINLPMDGKGIEALPSVAAAGAAPEDPVGETTDPRVALQALTGETPVAAFEDRLRRQLFCKGVEHHQHKYAAAVLEERRLVHPRFAPWIVAPSVAYLPGAGDDPSAVFEKAGAVLRSR